MKNSFEVVHTFTKGMNKDLDKTLRTSDMYFDARNIRIATSGNGTTLSAQVVEGLDVSSDEMVFETGHTICGAYAIRNYLILWTTTSSATSPTTGDSIIYRCTINEAGGIESQTKIYDDTKSIGSSKLLLSTYNQISAVGKWETDEILNIYWVDGFNNIRHFNAIGYLTEDTTAYNATTNKYISADDFDFVPNSIFSKPEIDEVISGTLSAGSIMYAYQFYNRNGSSTLTSPFTNPISITSSSSSMPYDFEYIGNDEGDQCGKGYRLKITNNNNKFNYIKLIALQYNTLDGTPFVRVAADNLINPDDTTIYINDVGSTLESLTLDEVLINSKALFKAKALESKDNMLFAANVTYDTFNPTFDARAYRFGSISTAFQTTAAKRKIAWLYDSDDNYIMLYPAGITMTGTGNTSVEGDWEYFSSTGTYDASYTGYNETGYGSGWSIPTTFDAINKYNDTDNDVGQTYRFLYQNDGLTIGGEGPNVSYRFVMTGVDLDTYIGEVISTDQSSLTVSYAGYSSETNQEQNRGWARDETYRVGIVFQDMKGRDSFVNWIGDIRTPSANDKNATNFTVNSIVSNDFSIVANADTSSVTTARVLGIYFSFSNLPPDAVSYRIVRVKREKTDRSILTQGILMSTLYDSTSGLDVPVPYAADYEYSNADVSLHQTDRSLRLFSPEISYNRDLVYSSGDYLQACEQYVGSTDQTVTPIDLLTEYSIYKVYRTGILSSPVDVQTSGISSTQQYDLTAGLIVDQGINEYNAGNNVVGNFNTDTGTDSSFYGGTSFFFPGQDSTIGTWIPQYVSPTTNRYTVAYKRRVFNSQYGGNTYEARSRNTYIAASDSYPIATTLVTTYQGDIFINYYAAAVVLADLAQTNITADSKHETILIPLESSLNLAVEHGFNFLNKDKYVTNIMMIQEVAGTWEDISGNILAQDRDMYLYNSVYSQDNTIPFIAEPIVWTEENTYDSRILNSSVKINGELSDSWLKFRPNNFIDVDTKYGPIYNLKEFDNKLLYWQGHGFGIVTVNQRSLINDGEIGGLVLGTGGILDRYDYISTTVGNTNKHGLVQSSQGMYWIDNSMQDVYRFSDRLSSLATEKGMKSHIKSLTITDVKAGWDKRFSEVLFDIKIYGDQDTLVFSEKEDFFSGFYDANTNVFIQTDTDLLSVATNNTVIYTHNTGNHGTFHGTLYPSTISILATDKYPVTKVFDNIEVTTETTNSSGVNIFSDFFNEVRVYNSYQNTDWRDLVYKTPVLSTDFTFERREQSFTLPVPRNAVNKDQDTNPNIFSAANLDVTQTFKDRIRDKYSMIEFKYNNTNNYSFSIPYVRVKYRVSFR